MKLDELFDITKPFDPHQQSLLFDAQNEIYEGLIKSYPIDSIISWFSIQKLKVIKTHYNFFVVECKRDEIDPKEILRMVNTHGWFISLIQFDYDATKVINKNINEESFNTYNADNLSLKIEAKFDIELSKTKFPKELYCLAPLQVKDKIAKIGLVPKSGKNVDNQPPRIYLSKYRDALINEMLPQLQNKDERYLKGAILITLNTQQFPDNVRLFIDENWKNRAYYAIVNIPRNCISHIEEI